MAEAITAKAVTLTFIQDKQSRLYLQQRANTGFMDGYWDTPSGKIDSGESITQAASREVLEETGLKVEENDLECFYAYINTSTEEYPFIGFLFRAVMWSGTPENKEPDKCSDTGFFSLEDAVGLRLTPMVRDGLARLTSSQAIDIGYYTL